MLKGDRDALAMKMLGATVDEDGPLYQIKYNKKETIIAKDGTVLLPLGYYGDQIVHLITRINGFSVVNILLNKNSYIVNRFGKTIFHSDKYISGYSDLLDNVTVLESNGRLYMKKEKTRDIPMKFDNINNIIWYSKLGDKIDITDYVNTKYIGTNRYCKVWTTNNIYLIITFGAGDYILEFKDNDENNYKMTKISDHYFERCLDNYGANAWFYIEKDSKLKRLFSEAKFRERNSDSKEKSLGIEVLIDADDNLTWIVTEK